MAHPDDEYDDTDDRDDRPPPPRKRGMGVLGILLIVGVLLFMCIGVLIGGLFLGVGRVREAANRMKSSNNLKQISLAVYNYESTHAELPGNTYTPDGKPLLSWRVHILPFIEQDTLYRQVQLDEPWDGPTNRRLLLPMPPVYADTREPNDTAAGKTHYRGFSSPGAVFERRLIVKPGGTDPHEGVKPEKRFGWDKFKDLTSETVLAVEARDPVEWTKPDDLDASPNKPFPPLGVPGGPKNRANVAFADGSVRAIRTDLPETTLRALVTYNGGETLPAGWDE